MQHKRRPLAFLVAFLVCSSLAHGQVAISVDAAANQHPIDARIYGIHFGNAATLADLNATINRYGGNSAGRYNWQQNVDNRGVDWFFQSIPYPSAAPGDLGDSFISQSQAGGADAFLTIPMVDYIARTNAGRDTLWSFSVAKYGAQQATSPELPDAGNGIRPDGVTPVVGNDPDDASTPNSSAFQQGWFQHVVDTFGTAAGGGLRYWGYDNEPTIWFSAYADVTPTGKHDHQMLAAMIDYGTALRAVDPGVTLLGPEEWGWDALFYSGFDQQTNAQCGYCGSTPDHDLRGDYVAYLLGGLHQHEIDTGARLLDVLSLHFYPQGHEYYPNSNASGAAIQRLRNRSTRGLWDPAYVNESYINTQVQLIPRLKNLVAAHYPGLLVGLTEYNWGGDFIMNGATVQADILGILGREGADIGIRWDTSDLTPAMPPYHAIKMYRNYDGSHSTFGDQSVLASAPDPDTIAAFAATRSSDGALTIMVINKALAGSAAAAVRLDLAGFAASSSAKVYQLAGTGTSISHLSNLPVSNSSIAATLPSPSVTLFVVPPVAVGPPTISISDATVQEGNSGTRTASFTVTLSAASAQTVTAHYQTADATATVANNDYLATSGTVTFAAGVTSRPVTVAVVGDTSVEPDETFSLDLSAPTNATIADAQGIGHITNDDQALPTLSIADASVLEGDPGAAGRARFIVRLSARSAVTVRVAYATAPGTAVEGGDYKLKAGTLTFLPGAVKKVIKVVFIGDLVAENDETFFVNLSSPTNATIADGQGLGTIRNDD